MEIKKFTKLKDNRYKILFDNELVITLYDDDIVKYNLLINKVMDDKTFKEITNYNDELDSYYKAIKYINRKLRSKKEIYKYLEKDYDNKIVNKTIKKLEHDGYLNEEIYLNAYINDQLNLTLNGPIKITKELVKLGLNEDNINKVINNIDKDVWNTKINKIIDKKIKSNHNYSVRKLKEKISYDLVNLGYNKTSFNSVLDSKDISIDSSLIEKEGNKIYNKLIKKYNDNELYYYLKNKLYLKGFSSDEIDNFIANKKTDL